MLLGTGAGRRPGRGLAPRAGTGDGHHRLAGWGAVHGLTVDELARIQPDYCMCEDDEGYAPVCGDDGVTYWNTCVANTCGGITVGQGACDYARETCPDYAPTTEAPAVTHCDNMWKLCGAEQPVYRETTWADWLAAQDQACIASTGDAFDGPDALPAEETPGEEPAACATTSGAGLLGILVAFGLVTRRRSSGGARGCRFSLGPQALTSATP
jgi:hypothetical protein